MLPLANGDSNFFWPNSDHHSDWLNRDSPQLQDQQDVELFLATTPRNFDRKSVETSLTTISTRF